MPYYVIKQRVLVNCGTREAPEWRTGVIEDVEWGPQPYLVKLDTPRPTPSGVVFLDGNEQLQATHTLARPSFVVDDNRQNRRKKGVPLA